ncbi:hypothetical protein TraAM80_02258 [Trypanosoma rangeli]|uniref:Uncharacterized protein n=1 Tax=Trypanosoma rangeli TaxID=5698 RepID=A0A3R7NXL1_TRYRA|nr:uncharacterized protein TraAM80_02258 [Trypanosoma rangeli]RNF09311.1 hypothetical protein TraAM80_02258 [Trypanosoma rangeli]|eukprot:RNF09311.1 hypothetical protein TraAM80_02258 [Trypanosoma rangeli]
MFTHQLFSILSRRSRQIPSTASRCRSTGVHASEIPKKKKMGDAMQASVQHVFIISVLYQALHDNAHRRRTQVVGYIKCDGVAHGVASVFLIGRKLRDGRDQCCKYCKFLPFAALLRSLLRPGNRRNVHLCPRDILR